MVRISRRGVLKHGAIASGLVGLAGCTGGDGGDGGGGDGGGSTAATTTQETTTAEQTPTGTESDEELMEMADPPDPFVLTNWPIGSMMPVFYALEKGLFEKRGLPAQITQKPIFGGGRNLRAVISGDAHIANSTTTFAPIGLAREQDEFMKMAMPSAVVEIPDFECSGDCAQGYPGGSYTIVNEEVNSWDDLRDTRWVVHAGAGGAGVAMLSWLADQGGLDPANDITIDTAPLPQIGGVVARGDAAAGLWFEPRITASVNEGLPVKRFAIHNAYMPNGGPATGRWTSAEIAEQHPATLKLFQRAIGEAAMMIKENPQEFAQISADNGFGSEDLNMTMFERGDFGLLPSDFENVNVTGTIDAMQDILLEYTEIDERVDPSGFLLPWNQ